MSSTDADFARLHHLSPETLRVIVDLAPQISRGFDNIPQPVPIFPRSTVAQDCYRLRLEASEQRYARMKGFVHASLAAQQRLEQENKGLRVAGTILRLGLEKDCSATLDAMLTAGVRGARTAAMVLEVEGLTGRLATALDENDKLMHFNRELRGEQGMRMVVEEAISTYQSSEEVEVLRKRIFALELECTRLQSDEYRFEEDERLRECEDVFDRILGRVRMDLSEEELPALRRYHPVGTCSDIGCVAYARRLRGGLRRAVAEAYARERTVRLNGFSRQWVEPVEALRAEKDAEIHGLRERICRFEQTMRMTSGEADEVELRTISLAILERATELGRLRNACTKAEEQFMQWRAVLAGLMAEKSLMEEGMILARRESDDLAAERSRTFSATVAFNLDFSGAVPEGEEARTVLKTPLGISISPDGTIFVQCKCGASVAENLLGLHVQTAHAAGSLLCSAGCGFFITNGTPADMTKHIRTEACRKRVAEIHRLRVGDV